MRMLLLIALLALPAFGQKKPVTLDALNDYRGSTPRGIPGEPVWAPDGKAFLFRQRSQLRLYDLAKRQARDLAPLDAAAATPPSAERHEWENRRVDEAPLQWDPAGRNVLYFTDGDIFL